MINITSSKKIAGTIKNSPEDFVVQEIALNGSVIEANKVYTSSMLGMDNPDGKFAVFVLQKKDWNTIQALRAIAKKFRRGIKSVGFAGTKDRTSISTQLCSLYGVKSEELQKIHIKDIQINGAWNSSNAVKLGDLLGNKFEVLIRGVSENDYSIAKDIKEELDSLGVFPNYFGDQRFGVRKNNFEIGLSMLKGDFESAAMRFLTDSSNELSTDAVEARKRLIEEMDFKKALNYFPRYLKYERFVIEYLSKYPGNYANAIRRLPRTLSLMFVHSVEDTIFNRELEHRLKEHRIAPEHGDMVCSISGKFYDLKSTHIFENIEENVIPVANIVGYDSKPNEFEKNMLEELGLSLEDFKLNGMPELNCKGSFRALFAPFKDLSLSHTSSDEVLKLAFSLPSGSYATVFIDEFLKQSITL
ncbi:MAG: tRNA pseudouridine(13) synthase TruD [Candidatus Micrarchaeia archaeon]